MLWLLPGLFPNLDSIKLSMRQPKETRILARLQRQPQIYGKAFSLTSPGPPSATRALIAVTLRCWHEASAPFAISSM
jgi:hypothetical protein